MLIVGLTGGISTGKSTVSARLNTEHKIPIVDADRIAREVVESGTRAYREIVNYFLPQVSDILNEDGSLNRPALGNAVFGMSEQAQMNRAKLNSIIHPAVKWEIARQVLLAWLKFNTMVILDIPLLFETGLYQFCGTIVTVYCSDETQLTRLMLRDGLKNEDALKRIESQMAIDIKAARSDWVIDNEGYLNHLYQEVDRLVENITPFRLWSWLEIICPPLGIAVGSALLAYRYLARRWSPSSASKL